MSLYAGGANGKPQLEDALGNITRFDAEAREHEKGLKIRAKSAKREKKEKRAKDKKDKKDKKAKKAKEKRAKKEGKGKKDKKRRREAESSSSSSSDGSGSDDSSDSDSDRQRKKRGKKGAGKEVQKQMLRGREAATVARKIVCLFPDVRKDFRELLYSIDHGGAVDVSTLPDPTLAGMLSTVFSNLGLSCLRGTVYALPEGGTPTLSMLAHVIADAPTAEEIEAVKAEEAAAAKREEDAKAAASQAARDAEAAEMELPDAVLVEGDEEVGPHPPKEGEEGAADVGPVAAPPEGPGPADSPLAAGPAPKRRVGPFVPPPEILAAAAAVAAAAAERGEAPPGSDGEDEDEGDMIGPPPPDLVAEVDKVPDALRHDEVSRMLKDVKMNAYEVLGVEAKATAGEIKKKYWRLSLMVHPDKCKDPRADNAFSLLNKCHKQLADADLRAALDRAIEKAKQDELREQVVQQEREAAQWRVARGEAALPGDAELLGSKSQARDTWMTDLPPEKRAPTGPPVVHAQSQFMRNGKQSRGDTSGWTDTPLQKAAREQQLLLEGYQMAIMNEAEEDLQAKKKAETAVMIDQYNQSMRPKSLVELHQEKMEKERKERRKKEKEDKKDMERDKKDKKGKKDKKDDKKGKDKDKKGGDWEEKHPWQPWDREKDLLHGPTTKSTKERLAGQKLDMRFDSGGTDRSFL